ncbi:synapse-associated protein 1 [Gadus morhua]|uniref:BSD domain-containing protein n=1 Tax=Gadus morhua TaxID=8049 RepID=A0A8C4ZNT0_GADMO|nr:synapse-associated protein 1 [Gadus morhua]
MFKGLGTWLGLERAEDPPRSGDRDLSSPEERIVQQQNEVNKQRTEEDPTGTQETSPTGTQETSPTGTQEISPTRSRESQRDQGLGDYIFSFATSATKKISESVSGTAQSLKRSVEDGSIDGILDKTFLGEFQKEQEKFVQENKAKRSDAAVPPWVGYNEEETIQQQILALSADRRNFLRDPPAGVQFTFDMELMSPLACVMLEEDQLLNRMRFDLVPKHVKEDVFWRNYFYRVSLVKQAAQLTALAAQQQGDGERAAGLSPQEGLSTENLQAKSPPASIGEERKAPAREEEEQQEEEEEGRSSPGVSEFVSDAYDGAALDQEDLRKEIKQLVLEPAKTPSPDEEPADWEKELQQELQEYEVVPESDNKDDQWDQEIEKMLQDS